MFQGYIEKPNIYIHMCFRFPPTSLANKYTECINRKQNPNTQKNQKKIKKIQITKKNTTHIQIVVITKENIQKTKKKYKIDV